MCLRHKDLHSQLDPVSTGKTCGNFPRRDRDTIGGVRERRAVHDSGDVISGVEKNAAKSAYGLLGAAFVASNRHAVYRGQNAVEMTHDLTDRDLIGPLAEHIAAACAGHTFHPPLRFQIQHDLFEETFWDFIPPRQLAYGNRGSAIVVHQRE